MKTLIVFCLIFSAVLGKVSYFGQKVISVRTTNAADIEDLRALLEKTGDTDVWTHDGNLITGINHVRVSAATEEMLRERFETSVYIDDIEKLIAQEQAPKPEAFFDNYRRYAEIVTELKNLTSRFPQLTQFTASIGKTVEGRDIPAIRISAAGFSDPNIKRFFFQGGQHAREWIGPATTMYITTQLLESYGKDPTMTELLDNSEFVIVPLVNPDGYEYAFTGERLWRKNRRKNTGGSFGVDLNRNWNDHWGGAGSSTNPASDTYHGTGPFSEPESASVSNYIMSMNQNNNILGAIDIHSYSQLVLRPYGWTSAKCPDETALKIIGDGVAFEIRQNSGKIYQSIRSIELYVTTGSASDWYYGAEGIWAGYTIELRDTGSYGFLLPANQIIPTGNEIWASIKYFSKTVFDTHP